MSIKMGASNIRNGNEVELDVIGVFEEIRHFKLKSDFLRSLENVN
jgi:hypothetical protein